MALLEVLLQQAASRPGTALVLFATTLLLSVCFYRLLLHPIAHIPGPFVCRITSLWLYYHSYIGDEATVIHNLHARYGTLLRVAPNTVDIADADAIQPIYVTNGGFRKADCYANFDIDGHKTIFSTIDTAYRTPRAKAVVPMFSTASLRANMTELYGCVDRMVERIRFESENSGKVNVLNLTRSLAVDVVSTHLFEMNYNGTEEKTERLSVSLFVDAFVAVGRFFYLPTTAFVWLEWAIERFSPDENTYSSMEIVAKFVHGLVDRTSKGDSNYPGRLMSINLERTEVEAQCKDLIFAGTDSTGINLATIFRYLAMNPEWHEKLRVELEDNSQAPDKADVQSLPLLSATVREGLRLSMANPTRLPHIVPPSGWTFKSTSFPAGVDVGCSAYELHMNATVFPEPATFKPERWLTDDKGLKDEMNKHWFAFGAGTRACIARNLAMLELFIATERVVESGVLDGATACQDKVEIFEWFNSSVKGEKIELQWLGKTGKV